MLRNCAFTIVAKNYIGLALVLQRSIYKYNSDTDFFIIVADEIDKNVPFDLPYNIKIAKNVLGIEEILWNEMAFKYNLTEFCTALKPYSIEYFFNKGYEKVVYLDPDTFFYSDIRTIFNDLDKFAIVLSPHILYPEISENITLSESAFLNVGVYNLGFIAVRNNTRIRAIITWWKNRLTEYAFIDYEKGLFTDQIWMNFIPAFLERKDYLISRNKGLDVAPWNFYEREVIQDNGIFYVKRRNGNGNRDILVFAHFSGYRYLNIAKEKKFSIPKSERLTGETSYDDIDLIFNVYRHELANNLLTLESYLRFSYSYSKFTNGVVVTNLLRRIYRAVYKSYHSTNPFDSEGLFYKECVTKHLISTDNGLNPDSLTKTSYNSYSFYERVLNRILYLTLRVLGVKRYTLLLRYLKKASTFEYQKFILGK